jgi:hypothetical protein
MKQKRWSGLWRLLGKNRFFWFITGLLTIEALIVALSGQYPMAFDEDYHLGIIRLYSHHISPIWNGQPTSADAYGAVFRNPSYLYHYLMSFPYRLIALFSSSQTVMVLLLRFINIGMFISGFVLFRKVLLKSGGSRALVHGALAVFVLIPVVPMLAGQINYDNLLLPLIALSLLLCIKVTEDKPPLKPVLVGELVVLWLLTSLVKYAFLPIALAEAVYVIVRVKQKDQVKRGFRNQWQALKTSTKVLIVLAVLISGGLFFERYGINLIKYESPVPDCSQVLSVQRCSAYGPWIRDYDYSLNKFAEGGSNSPVTFAADWLYGMWLRLYFAVGGPSTLYQSGGPLPVPALSGIAFCLLGLVALGLTFKRLLKRYNAHVIWLFVSVTLLYTAAIALDDLRSYLRTGQPVAINGRYLLVVMPLILIGFALAINELVKSRALKKLIVAIAIGSMVWGGGVLTYILRGNDTWSWPSPIVRNIDHDVQNVLGPITPGYYKTNMFLLGEANIQPHIHIKAAVKHLLHKY